MFLDRVRVGRTVVFVVGAALVLGAGTARTQEPATATPPVAPRQTVGPGLVPNVPKPVSRPAGWPGAHDTVDKEKHVLSSIRRNPGSPLLPATAKAEDVEAEGVVRAAFEQADATPLPRHEVIDLETAMIVARIGPEVVLESDLLTPKAIEWLQKVSPGLEPAQIRELKMQICRQVIDQHIETLLVYVDACREIPEDKLPEIRKNVDKAFDDQFLPKLMEEAKAANSLEYEQHLRSTGQSLERMRKMFFERGLAQEWLRKNVSVDEEIPHADMIAWYQNHLDEYDFPARARFESLSVKTGLKRSRQQAWDQLAAMGNEVLAGRPFADVAKARSEGPTASTGGIFDWTNQGSLASQKLDEAIFTLPVGQLSAIIEEENALHIVRVVERTPAGRTPFLEAQVGIRDKLFEERRKAAADAYLAKLRERTPVWTIFDGSPAAPGAGQAVTAGRPSGGSTIR